MKLEVENQEKERWTLTKKDQIRPLIETHNNEEGNFLYFERGEDYLNLIKLVDGRWIIDTFFPVTEKVVQVILNERDIISFVKDFFGDLSLIELFTKYKEK